jgi:hypothetical protein
VLDVPVGHTFIRDGISTGIAMARQVTSDDGDDSGPDDPAELDALASRLEVALDKLVRHLDTPRGGPRGGLPGAALQSAALPTAEVARRLDGLIARLRDALGNSGQD